MKRWRRKDVARRMYFPDLNVHGAPRNCSEPYFFNFDIEYLLKALRI